MADCPVRMNGSPHIITAGFALVIILMVVMAVVSMWRLEQIQNQVEQIHFEQSVHTLLAHRMYSAARERSYVLVRLVHEEDALVADEYAMRFWALAHQVAEARRTLLQADQLTPDELALLEKQSEATSRTVPLQEKVIELYFANRRHEAMAVLTDAALPAQEDVLASLSAFIEYQNREVGEASALAAEQGRLARLLLLYGGVLAIFLSIFIARYVSCRMSGLLRGIGETSEQLRDSLHDLSFQKQALDAHAIVSIADPQGRITYVNDKFCAISQFSREELMGNDHRIVNSAHHAPEFFQEMWRTIASGQVWQGEVRNRRKDGGHYWVSTTILPFMDTQGRPQQYVSVRTDITAIKEAEEMLESNQERLEELVAQRTAELAEREAAFQRLSETDMLTGVANRRKFDETLAAEISRAQRHGSPLTLVMLDIDHFKSLNDRYGHQTGDAVLVEFARIIATHIRAHDFFARWGGEEFAILATHANAEETRQFADKLRILVADHPFAGVGQVTVSMGVSVYQPDETVDALLARADRALYAAKAGGRNRVEVG